jgi:hypothetical protein
MSAWQRDGDQILRPILREVLREIQTFSGCQSVGIRLQCGVDYPYYLHEGFPEFFILKENSLCAGGDEEALYSNDGDPLLACVCGMVLKSHCEPRFPFFTEDGCFWTNCTTKLLGSSSKEEQQLLGRTRGMCHMSGYESVALVPTNVNGKILGLIQLNDPRVGMFTLEKISQYKAIADKVAIIVQDATNISEAISGIREMITGFEAGVGEERSAHSDGDV